MNINSEYIQKKEFHTTFKGYNMDEVDKFLDIIAVEFERLLKKNIELQESLDKIRYEGKEDKKEAVSATDADVNKLVSEVLISAHKIADEIKKKAEKEAEEIIKNKKDIEENDIKNLLREKNDIEEKVKLAEKSYSDFVLKLKDIVYDFNMKITGMENKFKIEDIKEDIYTAEDAREDLRVKEDENISASQNDINKSDIEASSKERFNKASEEEKELPSPELRVLNNESEEQKIREIIESEDFEEPESNSSYKEVKKDKKIFDEYEKDRILKNKKNIDIANPDIINEFFGNNDERKY
ncbi:MAG: DivIVA domain-containing protein [Actinomycetota bacterium]|nr:DivIVA domain-containing protein [Actinomycetota bacterium]